MAKGKIKNLGKVLNQLKDAMTFLNRKDIYSQVGEYVRDRITSKARSGKTMISGETENLKALSPAYIKERERQKKLLGNEIKSARKNKKLGFKQDDFNHGGKGWKFAVGEARNKGMKHTDPDFFSPKRSNLTFTGQFLESLKVTKIDQENRIVTIEPTGTRDDGLKNKKVGEYVAKQGRNIFGIDTTGLKVIKNMVIRELRNSLRKNLLKK
jgi:hypothetical protein